MGQKIIGIGTELTNRISQFRHFYKFLCEFFSFHFSGIHSLLHIFLITYQFLNGSPFTMEQEITRTDKEITRSISCTHFILNIIYYLHLCIGLHMHDKNVTVILLCASLGQSSDTIKYNNQQSTAMQLINSLEILDNVLMTVNCNELFLP